MQDGLIYLPLAELATALQATVQSRSNLSVTLTVPGAAGMAGEPATLTARTLGGRAYVPISSLTLLGGSKARYSVKTRSYQLYTAERTLLDLPLDLTVLLKLQQAPEYPDVLRAVK